MELRFGEMEPICLPCFPLGVKGIYDNYFFPSFKIRKQFLPGRPPIYHFNVGRKLHFLKFVRNVDPDTLVTQKKIPDAEHQNFLFRHGGSTYEGTERRSISTEQL